MMASGVVAVRLRGAVVDVLAKRALFEVVEVVVHNLVGLGADVPAVADVAVIRLHGGLFAAGFALRVELLTPVDGVEDLGQGPTSGDASSDGAGANIDDMMVAMVTMRFRMRHTENMVSGHTLFV